MQPFRSTRAAALLAALALPPGALAATLQTPPLFTPGIADGAKLFCQMRNVGTAPVTATIQAVDMGGDVTSTQTVIVSAGQGASHTVIAPYANACRTPPALGVFAHSGITCAIQKVSTSARAVTLQMLDYAGTVLAGYDASVPGGENESISTSPDPADPYFAASCRWIVSGSAKHFRASAQYWDLTTGIVTVAVPGE